MPRKLDPLFVYYVYVLFDWLGIPRYIGKAKSGTKRETSHERSSDPSNWLKNEFIEQTWIMLGEVPKTILNKRGERIGLNKAEAFKLEILLIAVIGRMDKSKGPLTNMTDGGDGSTGHHHAKHSPEMKKYLGGILNGWRAQFTSEELSARMRKIHANRTPEERTATILKMWKVRREREALMDPEELAAWYSDIATKREAKLSPEAKTERGKKSAAKMTPEARRERAKQGNKNLTPQQLTDLGKRFGTFEERSVTLTAAFARMTPQARSERSRPGGRSTAAKILTSAEQSRRAQKGLEKNREAHLNTRWINNGTKCLHQKADLPLPPGYSYGRLPYKRKDQGSS